MTTVPPAHPPVGALLRQWRERRRLSQLALALQAEISTRHLSFVETGRAQPSRTLLLHLAEQLDVPLRQRNQLLLAAGYAPVYAETALDAPSLASVRQALRQVLTGHEPYPAVVVDRAWNLVDANAGIALFTAGVATALLTPPVNVLRVSLHPAGMAPRIANLGEWRAHLLGRLRRQVALTAAPDLAALYAELRAYPSAHPEPPSEELRASPSAEPEPASAKVRTSSPSQSEPVSDLPAPGAVVVPLHFRVGDRTLAFFSTVATFGTPLDITVAELAIESFFPADVATAQFLQDQMDTASSAPSA